MSSLPHEMHTTHSISAVYFNKTIKWDHHQQVAKKLLAVAAVIHEAIQLQDNFWKALSRDEANHHSDGWASGTRCHSLTNSSRKRQQPVTTRQMPCLWTAAALPKVSNNSSLAHNWSYAFKEIVPRSWNWRLPETAVKMASASLSFSTGLLRKPSIPDSRHSSRSLSDELAVMATIGTTAPERLISYISKHNIFGEGHKSYGARQKPGTCVVHCP